MTNETTSIRYAFGKNWAEFIENNFSQSVVDDSREHLAQFIRLDSLKGMTFLDIGCGSGLHSLAAYQMHAERIFSFDYDFDSVETTKKIHEHAGSPSSWTVEQGSVLDQELYGKASEVGHRLFVGCSAPHGGHVDRRP